MPAIIDHPLIARLSVDNYRSAPRIVAVEPWGADYTLLPGEDLMIIAFGKDATPWFHIVESEGSTQVFCENTDAFQVLQNDRELECGHNSQA